MKLKTFIAVVAICFFTACGTPYRATDSGVLISIDAQRAFDQQYPNSSNVEWSTYDANVVVLNDWELSGWETLDASDYTVKFDYDNQRYYAWYNSDGTWVGSAYVVNDHTTLPAYVTSTLNMQYPAYTIVNVNKEFYKDKVSYEIMLKKSDGRMVVLMDENGNVYKYKLKPL